MGSLEELEVHAYFHNYHSKLKFVGSQVLRSRPDLPVCGQVVHSGNLHPEGSEGSSCQWENCDVGASSSSGSQRGGSRRESDLQLSSRSARLTIQSGSTDTSTITSKAPSRSLWPSSSSRLSSASGRVRPRCRSHLQLPPSVAFIKRPLRPCRRLWRFLQDQVPSEGAHAEPHSGEAGGLSHLRQHVLQQH